MADPLTALVDREAPAQTNFFSPPSGQGTLARYGNSRIGLAESEGLAKATGDLTRDRIDRAREQRFNRQADFDEKQFEQKLKMDAAQLKREELLADADERDAVERKAALEARSGLLKSFVELDAKNDPEIEMKINGILAGMPPGLLETDEVAKTMLKAINDVANDARQARYAMAAKKQAQENQRQVVEANRVFQIGEAGASEEDYGKAYTPEGEFDPYMAGVIRGMAQQRKDLGMFKDKEGVRQETWEKRAGETNEEWRARTAILQENRDKTVRAKDEEWRAREQEKNKEYDRRQGETNEEWRARTEISQQNRKELVEEQRKRKALLNARDLSTSAAARQRAVNQVLQDPVAFPKHVPVLEAWAQSSYKVSPDVAKARVKAQHGDLLAKAEEWDKNQMFKELDAAYDMPSAEAYVDLVPGLSPGQKAKRRLVWEHAYKDVPFETESESDTAPPAPEGVVEDFDPTAEAAPEAPAAPEASAPAPLPKEKWEVGKRYTMNDGSKKIYKGEGKWE